MEKIRALFLSVLPIQSSAGSIVIFPLGRPSPTPKNARKSPLLVFFIVSLALILSSSLALAVEVKDYVVQVTILVQTSPPKIRLVWPRDANANRYDIYRKALTASTWGTPIKSITTTSVPAARDALGYTDTTVAVGSTYEYRVSKMATGYNAIGYVYAGIEALLTENRGKLVLIVDETHAFTLAAELTRLEQDLTGDGWQVLRHDVARTAGTA